MIKKYFFFFTSCFYLEKWPSYFTLCENGYFTKMCTTVHKINFFIFFCKTLKFTIYYIQFIFEGSRTIFSFWSKFAYVLVRTGVNEGIKKLRLQNLNDRRENACLKFAQKCIKNEKVKNMFPISVKLSKMIKRKSDKFKVKFARTKRYRKSAIPYMVNLLNINNSRKKNILKKTSQR